jgi:hypothetical protein
MGDAFPFAHICAPPADEIPMRAEVPTSRAVARFIEAGSSVTCAHCARTIAFRARVRAQQVICNVYDEGRWLRVEHYHRDCYGDAGAPYGDADDSQPMRPRQRSSVPASAAASAA